MSRPKTFSLFVPIVVIMVIIDRLAKGWAVDHLHMGIVGSDLGIVDLTLVHNYGAAFGMGQNSGIVFIILTFIIIAAIVLWLAVRKQHGLLEIVALSLIAAGGIGNLIDRMTTGYVVDFIHFTFIDFPVFNIADICVTCGVIMFIVTIIFTDMIPSEESVNESK